MPNTQTEPEVIDTTSGSTESNKINLSPEEVKNIANHSSVTTGEIEEEELEPNLESTSLSVDDPPFFGENNPLFRIFAALVITGALAIAVLFVWSFWGKITGENNIVSEKTQKTEDLNSSPKINPINRYRAKLALINQDGDLQPKPEPKPEPRPEPKPEPRLEPRPEPRSQPRPEKQVIANPLDQWATLSQLGTTTGDSLTAQNNLQAQQQIAASQIDQNNPIQNVAKESSTDTDKNISNNLERQINKGQVGLIASVSIGQNALSDETKVEREFDKLSPGARDLLSEPDNSYLLSKREQFKQQDRAISSQLKYLSNLGTSFGAQPQTASLVSTTNINQDSLLPNNSSKSLSNSFSASSTKNVPLGSVVAGVMSTPVIWSAGVDLSQTRATINLSEPLLAEDGSVALSANSSIIVEVKSVNDNGLVILNAIAVSYQDSQGGLKQQPLPPGALLIRGEKNQPLITESTLDSGGTILGQDLLIGALGAGERGFEVLNEPSARTVVSDDGFFRSTENRDASLINGAAEGVFSTEKERLDKRDDRIIDEELARTKIYQVKADTPVSIYVNSFLDITQ